MSWNGSNGNVNVSFWVGIIFMLAFVLDTCVLYCGENKQFCRIEISSTIFLY